MKDVLLDGNQTSWKIKNLCRSYNHVDWELKPDLSSINGSIEITKPADMKIQIKLYLDICYVWWWKGSWNNEIQIT